MNRDEFEGKTKEVKGKFKQAAGDLADDQNLHDEGTADEMEGKTQGAIGTARRKAGEVVEDIGKAIKR